MWKTVRQRALLACLGLALTVSTVSIPGLPVTDAVATTKATVRLTPGQIYPGDVLFIRSKQAGKASLLGLTFALQPANGEYVAFVPVPMGTKPGTYHVTFSGKTPFQSVLTVKAKSFPEDRITVSKEMASMQQNTTRIQAEQKIINQARSSSAPTAYFTGPFIMPVAGKLTTPYGYRRVVNGKPANPHLAIDIANKTGTPVYASNNGKVVLARSLYLTGHTIMIDHGLRLFSSYGHLSEIHVKPGQQVKKGQVIGKMGSTGFSTGPHLHYAMLIGNTFINPNPFFAASPFDWQ